MKKLNTMLVIFTALILMTTTVACKETRNGWQSNYATAKALAEAQGKNIFLFVSGEDWDTYSTNLRTTIFETEEFMSEVEKDYVLVHLDFSNSRNEDQFMQEDAQVAMDFNATTMSLPAVILITNDGYVFGTIDFDETVTTPNQYIEVLKTHNEKAKTVSELLEKIEKAEGAKKAKLIDTLVETVPQSHRYLLTELAMTIPYIDPTNESGIIGKYQVQEAYSNAIQSIYMGDVQGAINALLAPVDDGFLSSEEKQELYYQAAYFYSMQGEETIPQVVEYLQKAYDEAPDSELSQNSIMETLEMYKQVISSEQES
ncbi:MAG: thioredoxin family protein [Spirochaetaceae bacterium]|nr:thioredoxin family protein [Spirochaetaceae bacterium]